MSAVEPREGAMVQWISRVLPPSGRSALILLNTPQPVAVVAALWDRFDLRICADGAANRLQEALPALAPELIVGDLDSASPGALEHFQERGSAVLDLSHSQDSTDLDKAFIAAAERGFHDAVVIGDFAGGAGRVDHMFGIIQSLFLAQQGPTAFSEVTCLSQSSMMKLLLPGSHVLPGLRGAKCGLVPISGPCEQITTRGLQWNLKGDAVAFGGLVSTSNLCVEDKVTVENSAPVLWTMKLGSEDEE